MAGDNPAVMRHLAGQGRIHDPEICDDLNRMLQHLALANWHITWLLMPRQGNTAAHEEAQEARRQARERADGGNMESFVSVHAAAARSE